VSSPSQPEGGRANSPSLGEGTCEAAASSLPEKQGDEDSPKAEGAAERERWRRGEEEEEEDDDEEEEEEEQEEEAEEEEEKEGGGEGPGPPGSGATDFSETGSAEETREVEGARPDKGV